MSNADLGQAAVIRQDKDRLLWQADLALGLGSRLPQSASAAPDWASSAQDCPGMSPAWTGA